MKSVEVLKHSNGRVPFKEWLQRLDLVSRAKVLDYVNRLPEGGSKKNVKSLGNGLFELKINFRSGYRVLILIISGGDKSTQRADIRKAKEYWRKYGVQN